MATVLDLVKHYQHSIEKYPKDEQKILKCIDKLFNLDVTVQHLQDTGVGRTVNALRKHPGDVGKASRALIYKWKCMVAAEESDQEIDHNNDTSSYNGHGNHRDSDENTRQSKSEEYQLEKNNYNYKNDGQKYNKEVNGNYSGTKRKYQSSEDEEHDMKKKKSSTSNEDYYDRKCDVKIKSEPKSDSDLNTDHSNSDETDSEISQLSEEEVKLKQEIKSEPTDYHKSSSKRSHNKCTDDKKESTSKKSRNSDKDSKHSNENKNKHDSQKSSSQEKSHTSHKHSNTNESSSAKKHKLDHSSLEKKQKDEKKSSKRHCSSSEKHRSSSQSADSGSVKHKNHLEKQSSKSDKHRSSSQSHKSDKDKHKSLSEKESSNKHKIKESSSSSSKEKHSSSSKEKSKDRSSSSKEKSDSKSEKLSNESRSKCSENKSKHEKHKSSSSSSSHRSSKSSSSKSKEDIPKKNNHVNNSEDSEDGIDCGSGASFAEALGMLSPAKPKKKSTTVKETQSPNSITNDVSPAALLAPNAKLAPLPALEISALPEISPNYKPRPPPKLLPHFTDEEAMSAVISSKNQRTKVYSGNKVMGKIPTLYEMCVHLLQEHIDALEYTGGVPYELLKPVVDKATPQQLFVLEHFNPYLMEDTDHLWQKYCEKHFRKQQRHEMETWREMYIRCQEEQEHRLKNLTANIKIAQEAKKAPIKQTKMAYVDTVVKPPRNIARKQALHGTARAAAASPAARVAALATPLTIRAGSGRPAPSPSPASVPALTSFKPKKAPLMQKALQFMRGRKR
ncbi:transcription elongation factor B polypeptide 3-like [Galleria mellonella]|uniref:Transcription elongation factor B polypeptide 3-like n=1 Tax=Galleria mellonella TaxID=7137 RepID=A0A6J1WUS5_GALME|nr:transcription elongation factor B polypeptide 3-like [Galleria mellonella]